MISAIGGNNSIQMINALKAFKANNEMVNAPKKNDIDTPDGIDFKGSDALLTKVDVSDVKSFAKSVGETISDDDIKYGLTYGRSVIADFIA